MPTLNTVLKDIKEELKQKDKIRKETQESMRQATSLSKQAILLIHRKKMDEAQKMLTTAKDQISNLQTQATQYPAIIYSGMFSDALQEYAEANIFYTLITQSRFIKPEEISVPPVEYVLGLADVVGEYRRYALDALREGNVKLGGECLELMDEIFMELMALDEAYMLVPGLRRKQDVARKIIETTRGDVTVEIRRESLEEQLRRFEPSK